MLQGQFPPFGPVHPRWFVELLGQPLVVEGGADQGSRQFDASRALLSSLLSK
jgi:hypothetical protein